MPTPTPGESEDDFMARCIPKVLAEGIAVDASQASAICASYWDNRGQDMQYERRDITVPVEVRELDDGTTRMVGYAIRYNEASVDMGGFTEYVAPGAARSATMDGVDVLALWSHDTSQVLGRTTAGTLRLTEDEREYSGLAYVPMRGGIIEPITNRLAEPVIGRIIGWRYEREGCC